VSDRDNKDETPLLSKGADVNAKNSKGETALMWASQIGPSQEVVRAFLAKGADVNAKTNDGRTALDFAKAGGWDEIRAILVTAGAK
jgi:ankyrin repeat protein